MVIWIVSLAWFCVRWEHDELIVVNRT